MKKIAVVLIPLTLMACSSLSKTDSAQVSDKSAKVASGDAAPSGASPASAAETETRRLLDAAALLQKQSIYF
ncbi:MAG TPA: hypothetical protein VFM46_00235, partial [Pseudomonadales bacterium]|nr:hypothetical protein [Pseudomonadales bacterium]